MALDLDGLIRDEVRRVEAQEREWQRRIEESTSAVPKIRHFSFKKFVEMVYEVHRPQVEEWEGWRYHGALSMVEDTEGLREKVQLLWAQVADGLLREVRTSNARTCLAYLSAQLRRYDSRNDFDTVKNNLGDYSAAVLHNVNFLVHKVVPKNLTPGDKQKLLLGVSTGHATYSVPVRAGQSISKAVFAALETGDSGEYAMLTKTFFERLFSKLGEGASETPFATTLSVAPSSFLRLGEFGEKSCYRNGGDWEIAKHIVALTPHSFVGLFYREKDATKLALSPRGSRLGRPAGRCWGLVSKNGLFVTNFYLLPIEMARKSLESVVLKLCPGQAQHSKDEAQAACAVVKSLHGAYTYLNPDSAVLHAAPGFLKDVTDAKNFVVGVLGTQRGQGWADPCCLKGRRAKLIKSLPHNVTEKSREPQQTSLRMRAADGLWYTQVNGWWTLDTPNTPIVFDVA